MSRSLGLFFLCTTFYGFVHAQNDSLPMHSKHSFKPTTDFDQRFTYIDKKRINIWGQRGGLLINESFKVGVGVYFSNHPFDSKSKDSSGFNTYYGKRNLTFGTIYFEPFLIRKTFWELSIPFELGLGRAFYKNFDTKNGHSINNSVKLIVPSGTGLSLSFKLPKLKHFAPLHWIGINFLAGYRYSLFADKLQTNYNGMFWSISGAIFLERISDDYKNWRKRHAS